jgi:hypothetical protein
MTQDIWNQVGWRENSVYPGVHWLFYDKHGSYLARVDRYPSNNGLYTWRVMHWSIRNADVVGEENTLESAQHAADQVMNGIPFQLKLIV